MKTRCHYLVHAGLVACLFLVAQSSGAQGCSSQQPTFPEPAKGVNTIEVVSYGGFPGGGARASIDAMGRVAWLEWPPCPEQSRGTNIDPRVFYELEAAARRAIESIQSQPHRPNPSTWKELQEIVEKGRLEPFCMSPTDGVDVDLTLYIGGKKTQYSCVTGELLKFGRHTLEALKDAIDNAA